MGRRLASRLRIQLLGKPTWATEQGEGHLDGDYALLVAAMALQRRPATALVAAWLWPDAKTPMQSLYRCLGRLRDRVGHLVCEQDQWLTLLPVVEIDLRALPDAWPDGGAEPDRRVFLHGIKVPTAQQGWLQDQREHWARSISATDKLRRARELESAGTVEQGLALACAAVDSAPWLAEAWLDKARLQYLCDQCEAASHTLEQLRIREPLHESTRAMAAELRRSLDRSLAGRSKTQRLPASLGRPPVLIGRDAPWAAALGAWSAARPFVLIGEPGIGKSRLLAEFFRDQGGGLVVLAGRYDERSPYATLATLLRRVFALLGLQAPGDVPPALAGVLSLGDTMCTGVSDELAIRNATRDLLLAAAADVRAIAVDRLESADVASIEMLRALAQGTLRDVLHFAFASRPLMPGPRRDALEAWSAAPEGVVPISLAPWTQGQLAELLGTVELPRSAGRIAPADLLRRTGGVPQLVMFTLQDLARSDAPTPASTTAHTLNDDAHPALQARLRQVPASARPLLELAAVADAEPAAQAQALECSQTDVAAMASELAALGIMADGRFVHDLMREAALAILAPAALQRWSAVAAALLAPDRRVSRAQIGALWEAAERWSEAAAAYRWAGLQAADLGRLEGSRDLLHASAACSARAQDRPAEFEALQLSLAAELALMGLDDATRLVQRLHSLATTPAQRADVATAQALLQVSQYARGPQAVAAAARALQAAEAADDAERRAAATSLLAAALAQAGEHAEAAAAAQRAWALARLACGPRKAREIGTNLAYVLWEANRIGDALALSRELMAEYQAAGDTAGAAAVEGNVANLLLIAGHPAASILHSQRAFDRHCEMGTSLHSMGAMNRVALALAHGHEGRFTEALGFLSEQGQWIGAEGLVLGAGAKVLLTRAHLLLLLGDDEGATRALAVDDSAWPMAMQVQRCWAMARAERMCGRDDGEWLRRMAALMAAAPDTPLVHTPWLEWSRQGQPQAVAERLRAAQQQFVDAGMDGVARTVALRRIDRLGEVHAPWAIDSAAALVAGLRPQLEQGLGLHAATYLPEAWLILAGASRRAGDAAAAEACVAHAQRWVLERALPHVPDNRKSAFCTRNPVNRVLLAQPPIGGSPADSG